MKEHFFFYGFDLVNTTDADRQQLTGVVNLTPPTFATERKGTREVDTTYPGPSHVESERVEDTNEATHDGTTQMMDRWLDDLKLNPPLPPEGALNPAVTSGQCTRCQLDQRVCSSSPLRDYAPISGPTPLLSLPPNPHPHPTLRTPHTPRRSRHACPICAR